MIATSARRTAPAAPGAGARSSTGSEICIVPLLRQRFGKPVRVRPGDGLGAVRDAELAIEGPEVELVRLHGHPELLRDLVGRRARRDGAEDLQLAGRQPRVGDA